VGPVDAPIARAGTRAATAAAEQTDPPQRQAA